MGCTWPNIRLSNVCLNSIVPRFNISTFSEQLREVICEVLSNSFPVRFAVEKNFLGSLAVNCGLTSAERSCRYLLKMLIYSVSFTG